jgi:hypothetical protein
MCLLLGGVGLIYAIFPLIGLAFRELNIETFLAVSGISLLVAAVGFWYGRQWWLFFYGLFVGVRLVVRFSEDVIINGDLSSILKYVVLALFWTLLGFRLWKLELQLP